MDASRERPLKVRQMNCCPQTALRGLSRGWFGESQFPYLPPQGKEADSLMPLTPRGFADANELSALSALPEDRVSQPKARK